MWIAFLSLAVIAGLFFHTKHQATCIFIIVTLSTSVFRLLDPIVFSSPIFLNKPYDYAFLSAGIALLLSLKRIERVVQVSRIARLSAYYLGFILFLIPISVFAFNYSATLTIQSARIFLWPIFFILFLTASFYSLSKTFNFLAKIYIILALLYIQQFFSGLYIFEESFTDAPRLIEGTSNVRLLITPDFTIFFAISATAVLLNQKKSKNIRSIYAFSILLLSLLVQIISMTRSAVLATLLSLLHHLKIQQHKGKKAFLIITALGAISIIATFNPDLQRRFQSGLGEIAALSENYSSILSSVYEDNFSFRIAHLSERLDFIFEDPMNWPIGVGLIHETSQFAQGLGFRVGLPSNSHRGVTQVDTGDIAWSVIVMKTGLMGLAFLIIFLGSTYIAVSQYQGIFSSIYKSTLIYFLVTSFFSSALIAPDIMIQLMFFLALATHRASSDVGQWLPFSKVRH